MSLDLDPTEQQLATALGRLAAAYVPEVDEPPAPAQRPDHRRWLALAVAASLIALVAGIWAVAGRDAEPAPITVPPTPAPPPTSSPVERPLPSSIGIIAPDAAEQLGLDPTAWLQRNPEAFIDDASPPTYAIRRGATPGAVMWQILPSYWWQTSRLGGTAVALEDGRTAFRSDEGATVTLSVLLDGGVLNAIVGADDETALRTWLSGMDPAENTTTLEPPSGYEVVGATVAGVAVAHMPDQATVAADPASVGGTFVITIELDRDAALADVMAARYRNGAFAPLDEDPSVVFDPELQVLVRQAGPRTFVEVLGTTPEEADAIAAGMVTVASDAPELVPGVRGFEAGGQIPAASLTRVVLASTPYGRFAYSEIQDGGQICWRMSSFLGGKGGCGRTMSNWPICFATGQVDGPWDAVVMVIDRKSAEIVVQHDGATVAPATASGVAVDGTPWVIGLVTGVEGNGDDFPARITVDGTPCAL